MLAPLIGGNKILLQKYFSSFYYAVVQLPPKMTIGFNVPTISFIAPHLDELNRVPSHVFTVTKIYNTVEDIMTTFDLDIVMVLMRFEMNGAKFELTDSVAQAIRDQIMTLRTFSNHHKTYQRTIKYEKRGFKLNMCAATHLTL